MKFKVKRQFILDVLSKVQGLTGRKTSFAITSCVLIKTADSGIKIIATDLETGLEGFYEAEIEQEGSIALNSQKLYEIIHEFPQQEIEFEELDNRVMRIGDEKIEFKLMGMDPDNFPSLPDITDPILLDIDSSHLKEMLVKNLKIVAPSDMKKNHCIGIYLEKLIEDDDTVLRMVSTDGSRLSKMDFLVPKDGPQPEDGNILIPKKGLSEVIKFLEDEGTIKIGKSGDHFIIKKETETLIIRLLEGEFPKYHKIFEMTDESKILLNREKFLGMLKRMIILSTVEYKGVIFRLENDLLTILVENPEMGQSKEEMTIEFKAEPIEVAYNPTFFINTLDVLNEESIVMRIYNNEQPCFLEGEAEKNYQSVIMPMIM